MRHLYHVEDFVLAEKAVRESELLLQAMEDSEMSWTYSNFLDSQKYMAVMKGDFETAYDFSEELLFLQFDLLEQEQEEALTQIRLSSETAMYQSETDRLALETQQQQQIIAANNQLRSILIVLVTMLVACVVTLFVALRRKVIQMRILQQYSAISESLKSKRQQVMDNVAGMLFDQSERQNSPLSVLIFEFTSLSSIREEMGSDALDASIRWIKELLELELRTEDKLGQLSFDQFMLLLPGADTRVAMKQADRFLVGHR